MGKLTEKELKREFKSPRNQWRFAITSLAIVALVTVAFMVTFFDPLGWFSGSHDLREAKKGVTISVCFIWLPMIAAVWFLVIRPLRTGVVSGGSKYRTPYLVLRSEQPRKFQSEIWGNVFLIIFGFAVAVWTLNGFIHDWRKAKAEEVRAKSVVK